MTVQCSTESNVSQSSCPTDISPPNVSDAPHNTTSQLVQNTLLHQKQPSGGSFGSRAVKVLKGIPLTERRGDVSDDALAKLSGLPFINPKCIDILLEYAVNLPLILEKQDHSELREILQGRLDLLQHPGKLRDYLRIFLD